MIEAEAIWAEYVATRDPNLRSVLIEAYVPLVGYVAGRVHAKLPPGMDRDELVSFGHFGLIDAVEKYEPERGIKFEAYAMQRIKGSILDGLRGNDWVPRSTRTKNRNINRAREELEGALGREPTTAEIAAVVGIGESEVRIILHEINNSAHASLLSVVGEDATLADYREDRSTDAHLNLEIQEAGQILAERLAALPERERTIAVLIYYYEMAPTAIGKELGVSESRVCQLQPGVIEMLRA
jgi:RNA polymerase sigma factor for flagellar operon FliA